MKHDLGIAQRFREFRKKYVENNIKLAGPLLGISKSKISDMENGRFAIDMATVKLLQSKYKLNDSWLVSGKGSMLVDANIKKTGLQSSIEMGDRIDMLNTKIRILEANLNKAYNAIEVIQKRLDKLEK